MQPYGGIYSSHSRSESAGLFKSVQECIDIARQARVRVVISHFKCTGKTFWGHCAPALAMIDEANRQGLDVHLDAYPYIACSTTTTSAIPARFLEQGPEAFAQSLNNPKIVEEIRREIFEIDDPSWDNSALHVGLENFLIVGADETPEFVGKTYAQVGQDLGISPFDAMIRLLRLNHGMIRDLRYSMCEENVEMILKHPRCVVGSDGMYAKGRDPMCHPRAIGTFPRYLGHYIRKRKILSPQEGIRRITGQTADLYGLKGKGYIRPGYDADLVLFDFDRICDRGDFQNPFRPNEGIHQVYMNGQLVLQDNESTGIFVGKCLNSRM
jgi:N-acyl-D-aspartate/D-glutamate deacylase